MKSIDLLKKAIIDAGYDGLYVPGECACRVDQHFIPCEGNFDDCLCGVIRKYDGICHENCKLDCEHNSDSWCLGQKPPEVKP